VDPRQVSAWPPSGFRLSHLGNAVSVHELVILPKRFDESSTRIWKMSTAVPPRLTFDRGLPYWGDKAAGIDACYR